MPTSIRPNYHFMAKLAKNRMLHSQNNPNSYDNRTNSSIDSDFYYKVATILLSDEKIYNPISRLIGKDLEQIPNSSEKQRAVFQVINKYDEARTVLKKDLLQAVKENRKFQIRDISIDPTEVLCKF